MKNLKEKLSKLSVLVFGDMYLDRDCIGDFRGRKSKENDNLQILDIHTEKYQPGGAGNLAFCFATLGVKTYIVGLWGGENDIHRQIIEQSFKNRKIDTSFMVESGNTPVFGKFYLSEPFCNHIFRYDINPENITDKTEQLLIENIKNIIKSVDFVACADYNECGTRDIICENTLKPILETKIPKFVTGRKDIKKFKGFNTILLNEKELSQQRCGDCPIPSFFEIFENDYLVKTSDKFSIVFTKNNTSYTSIIKTLEGKIDTCGCGDMFYAMYASSIMAKYSINKSLELANSAARIVAKKLFGATQASIDEILKEINL